jgi:DNA polymerase-1
VEHLDDDQDDESYYAYLEETGGMYGCGDEDDDQYQPDQRRDLYLEMDFNEPCDPRFLPQRNNKTIKPTNNNQSPTVSNRPPPQNVRATPSKPSAAAYSTERLQTTFDEHEHDEYSENDDDGDDDLDDGRDFELPGDPNTTRQMDIPVENPFPFPIPEQSFVSHRRSQTEKVTNKDSRFAAPFSFQENTDSPFQPQEKPRQSPPKQQQQAKQQFASILEPASDRKGQSFDSYFLDPPTVPLPLTDDRTVVVPSLESNRMDDTMTSLEEQLMRVEREIYTMNNDKKFNVSSPKQVSQVLFGRPDMSTSKHVLDGMAATNILAKLILEYRTVKQKLTRLAKKKEQYDKQQQQQQKSNKGSSISTTNQLSSSLTYSLTSSVPHDNDPLLLIDTSSFIFRAYYSMPPLHRSDGLPIGAVMGFCNMLNRLLLNDMFKGKQPRVVLCLDAISEREARTFRHELYSDYKAHRPSLPLDLIPQFELINQAAKAYGIIQIQADGYEADDVMATLGSQACFDEGLNVRILSGDKDLMQLITHNDDENAGQHRAKGSIQMMDPMTMTPWTHETVIEKWGVSASQLGDVLALAGDTADNIPGVPGIGPKIAAQLMQDFGTLEELLQNTDKVKQKGRREKLEAYKDQALLSRELVDLVRDLNWDQMEIFYPTKDDAVSNIDGTALRVGDLRMEPMDPDRLLAFYEAMGFHTIKQRFMERLARQPPRKVTDWSKGSKTQGDSATTTLGKDQTEKTPAKRSSYTPKKKMGIPKPEDYIDVPF